MNLADLIKKLGYKSSLTLLLLIVISTTTIIVLNYYTIKILSASRAYVNGESLYSKAHKDASRYLILYVYSANPSYWKQFNEEMRVPLGFRIYRNALDSGKSEAIVHKGLIQAKFPKADWGDVIWLYKNFSGSFLMKRAIEAWRGGDSNIDSMLAIGNYVHTKLVHGKIIEKDRDYIINRVNTNVALALKMQQEYVNAFGHANKVLGSLLFLFNLLVTFFIISGVGFYAIIMINKLASSKQEVEKLSRVKDQFLTVASHELKTPIATMKASLQIIERIASKQGSFHQLHPFISKANSQVLRLTGIVNDLLDVSKIREGQLHLKKNYFELEEAIKEAIEQVNPIENSYKIDIQGDASLILYADKARIEQVLINFLSNAIKYSPNQKHIIIKSEKLGDELKVSVIDSGIGIPEEKINRVFDRFFRVQEISDKFSGLGIGLYISSEIIKKHNGEIGVVSKVDQGSNFWFKLPLSTRTEAFNS